MREIWGTVVAENGFHVHTSPSSKNIRFGLYEKVDVYIRRFTDAMETHNDSCM